MYTLVHSSLLHNRQDRFLPQGTKDRFEALKLVLEISRPIRPRPQLITFYFQNGSMHQIKRTVLSTDRIPGLARPENPFRAYGYYRLNRETPTI